MEVKETYDITFKCPFNCIIAGPTGSGKSNLLKKFLKYRNILCDVKFEKVILFYSMWQPLYDEMKESKFVDDFIEDIPSTDELLTIINQMQNNDSVNPPHQLLIFDDLLTNITQRKDNLVSLLATVFGHHKNLSLIFISQLLFKPGDNKYNIISENIHYLFFMKSPRNSSKIIHLAKQISPYDISFIVEGYKNATKAGYSYIMFDFHQTTDENVKIRTNVFPNEKPLTVYLKHI
jgi:hypothetical protein